MKNIFNVFIFQVCNFNAHQYNAEKNLNNIFSVDQRTMRNACVPEIPWFSIPNCRCQEENKLMCNKVYYVPETTVFSHILLNLQQSRKLDIFVI